jgi:hypothetical protein
VVERAGGTSFLLEASNTLGVARCLAAHDLDRDVAPEAGIARAVDLAHTARAERGDDLVGTEPGPGSQRHRVSLPQE